MTCSFPVGDLLDLREDDMAQFERAPQENLILLQDHILDKKILDLDGHEVEIVYDVKLAFQNDKLYAAEVDFSHYQAALRRPGSSQARQTAHESQYGGSGVLAVCQPLPFCQAFAGNIKLKVPKAGLSEIHPVDLADILEELEGGQRVALFNALDAEQASDTLEEVEPRVQRELIRVIEKERAALLINEMTPAQAADILAILPRDQAHAILKLLDRDKSSRVEHIIDQHDEQILLYGSPEIIKLPSTTPAEEVLDRYRELARGKEVVMYVYIVRCGRRVEGCRGYSGNGCCGTGPDIGRHHDGARDFVAEGHHSARGCDALRALPLRALPITDDNDQLLGAVSSRDVRSLRPRLARDNPDSTRTLAVLAGPTRCPLDKRPCAACISTLWAPARLSRTCV